MSQPDLAGFAALFGDSLTSRVALLERLLQKAHYPSIGAYKERLLATAIADYLPRSVEVGSGFVLFPEESVDPARAASDFFDPMNQSGYSVSKQCDVLIYDVAQTPPIFRDGNFVVVRPEAVRAVIEVKGALTTQATKEALESLDDFAKKWQATQRFYRSHSQRNTSKPGLFVLAWDYQRDGQERPRTNPAKLRSTIAEFYRNRVDVEDAEGYPFLLKLLVHRQCEIGTVFGTGDRAKNGTAFGMLSHDGRFYRLGDDGKPSRDRDRTIASLLASLHILVAEDNFNRFFSYTDEIRPGSDTDDEHYGIE